jgi:hypothetical protein
LDALSSKAEIIPNKSDCATLYNRFYIPDPDNAGVGILISIKTAVFTRLSLLYNIRNNKQLNDF